MRKRDKKKEKAKAEFVAKKRKELYEDVVPGGRRVQAVGEEGGKKKLGHRQRVCFGFVVECVKVDADFLGFGSNVYRLRRVRRLPRGRDWRRRRLQ